MGLCRGIPTTLLKTEVDQANFAEAKKTTFAVIALAAVMVKDVAQLGVIVQLIVGVRAYPAGALLIVAWIIHCC